jgi:hypothetical protein
VTATQDKTAGAPGPDCGCQDRPAWAHIEDDTPLGWPVLESGEWEELRQCPTCGLYWLCTWPEEMEGRAILCRPVPPRTRRLRDLDRAETLRGYMLSSIEEHVGALKEEKTRCIKQGCDRKRIQGTTYCIEHLIAQRFGRQLSRLGREQDADLL